jgi:hypothetical protein
VLNDAGLEQCLPAEDLALADVPGSVQGDIGVRLDGDVLITHVGIGPGIDHNFFLEVALLHRVEAEPGPARDVGDRAIEAHGGVPGQDPVKTRKQPGRQDHVLHQRLDRIEDAHVPSPSAPIGLGSAFRLALTSAVSRAGLVGSDPRYG